MSFVVEADDWDELTLNASQAIQSVSTIRRVEPPVGDDNFLVDVNPGDSPGLDTGCTFNTSSLNPLTINVPIDKFVGEVDEEGYLINPTPLIDAGIIPAIVSIKLPAFDVDTPDEKNELFFNGERVGVITGKNQQWISNEFTIPIEKIKFPSKPASGQKPTPVKNLVKVYIDVLNGPNRWCTAIDWVNLEIPIKPKFALELQVIDGNKIADDETGEAIDTIYKEEFVQDSELLCEITTLKKDSEQNYKTDYDKFPFSGSRFDKSRLKAILKACPEGSTDLDKLSVELDWNIANTEISRVVNWIGDEGEVDIEMPSKDGIYATHFSFKIKNGNHSPERKQTINIDRKLFVTLEPNAPYPDGLPKLGWYEAANEQRAIAQSSTQSVNELTVKTTESEDPVTVMLIKLEEVLQTIYKRGNKLNGDGKWQYKYGRRLDTEDKKFCSGKQLTNKNSSCRISNCYGFSQAFDILAFKVEGVDKKILEKHTVFSKHHLRTGFITKSIPALDEVFTGNTRLIRTSNYNRYRFSDHSLRRLKLTNLGYDKDYYYDATFGQVYKDNPTEFILAHLKNSIDEDEDGVFVNADKDFKVYGRTELLFEDKPIYDIWGTNEYKFPDDESEQLAQEQELVAVNIASAGFEYTGNVNYRPIDVDDNGVFEALAAEIEVNVFTAGRYSISGILRNDSGIIANASIYLSPATSSSVDFDAEPELKKVIITFSGEQIFELKESGPYELDLLPFPQESTKFTTPAYNYQQFGEILIRITDVVEEGIDENNDGMLDTIKATVNLNVRAPADYPIEGSLSFDERSNASGNFSFASAGEHQIELFFPVLELRRSGKNGPYDGIINVLGDGVNNVHLNFKTQAYLSENFNVLVENTNNVNEQGISTNGNDLFNYLRVSFDAEISKEGTYIINADLEEVGKKNGVSLSKTVTLSEGMNTITLDFDGESLFNSQTNGPYQVKMTFRDPVTQKVVDYISLDAETAPYSFEDFDSTTEKQRPIMLDGTYDSVGIDTDNNGLFNQLVANAGLKLLNSGNYQWSADLIDANGNKINSDSSTAFLNAGDVQLNFIFDGNKIGQSGIDGPYFIRNLLIIGGGTSFVSTGNIVQAEPYTAEQFEGFILDKIPPQLNIKLDKSVLWPANHKMIHINAVVKASDNIDPSPKIKLISITSDESDNALGDGNTSDDIEVIDEFNFKLRAERSGNGDTRVYEITYQATDLSGNIGTKTVTVTVPHN